MVTLREVMDSSVYIKMWVFRVGDRERAYKRKEVCIFVQLGLLLRIIKCVCARAEVCETDCESSR